MATLCFWDMLGEAERAEVTKSGREHRYRAGERILSETDKDRWTGVILDGKCRVVASREDGSCIYLAARRTGDIIGEMAAVRDTRRSAAVTAVTAVRLHVLSRTRFQHLLESHPGITRHLLSVTMDRLQEADQCRADLAIAATELRLSRLLLRLVSAEGVPTAETDGIALRGVSQLDLADWCGISRKSVQRHLKKLEDLGILQAGRRQRQFVVPDLAELSKHALVAPH